MKRFEVLWYEIGNEDPVTREFSTRQAALNFYEKHKDEPDKSGWWVTKRNSNWKVTEDIVY